MVATAASEVASAALVVVMIVVVIPMVVSVTLELVLIVMVADSKVVCQSRYNNECSDAVERNVIPKRDLHLPTLLSILSGLAIFTESHRIA